jgi:DNA-binding NarL/FixJ family response regulator
VGIVSDSHAQRIRVVLVDDDPLVRAGLAMILRGAPHLDIVGEAGDGVDGLAVIEATTPDVVLMDIRMPRMDGLDATKRLSQRDDPPAVIVLTTFDADQYVVRALAHGATGFLLKDTPPALIVEAIDKVVAGEPILSPSVMSQLIRQVVANPDADHPEERSGSARKRLSGLTEREHEVAVAIGRGGSNAEIAAELFMSVATVKAHVTRILTKLDASNRVQVAICVYEAGLL